MSNVGDCFNVIYESGPLRLQAPAMIVSVDGRSAFLNLATHQIVKPLSLEPMAPDRLRRHGPQIADARIKWGIDSNARDL